MGRDNSKLAQAKTLGKLSDNCHNEKKSDISQILQRNIDYIAQLKDRLKEFEQDNDAVASENEELRHFSMNGYQIAKNVQALQQERETLSVDLADKANTIKSLLNQNETLSANLRHINDHNVY